VDIVFTDVPYGQHSHWQGHPPDGPQDFIRSMLDTLFEMVSSTCILAIASDKRQKIYHEGYQRMEQFQVGKRRVVILKPGKKDAA
jgi:tRNA G10  N-methylase Trm11